MLVVTPNRLGRPELWPFRPVDESGAGTLYSPPCTAIQRRWRGQQFRVKMSAAQVGLSANPAPERNDHLRKVRNRQPGWLALLRRVRSCPLAGRKIRLAFNARSTG